MNRCLTEGRRSFLQRIAGIESGAECDRLAPLLSALADGEATASAVATLRPHLRSCLACRAALRAFRELPNRTAEIVPAAATTAGSEETHAALWRWSESVADWAQERVALVAAKLEAAVQASGGGKVAAVAASTAALAGGTAAVRSIEGDPGAAARPPAGQAEPLLERAVPVSLPQPPPPTPPAPIEPQLAAAPIVPPPEPALPPAPLPPAYVPPAKRSDEFPKRIATPIDEPGESAVAGTGDREREIDPMTEPAEPPPGRPSPERLSRADGDGSATLNG